MKVTIKRVFSKSDGRADQTLISATHVDSCIPGPTIGPVTVMVNGGLFWPGKPFVGEPVGFGPGCSIVITCEDE